MYTRVYTRRYLGGIPCIYQEVPRRDTLYIPPWVCTTLYHPGYVHPYTTPGIPHPTNVRHTGTRRTTGRDGYAALTHRLAELNISDEPLTVASLLLLSFPFHCWSGIEACWLTSQKNTVGRRHVAQSGGLPPTTRFTVGRC